MLSLFFEGGLRPHNPVGPPLLTPVTTTEREALFTVDLMSGAAPRPGEVSGGDILTGPTQPEIPPVVFLFRVEERSSHNIS